MERLDTQFATFKQTSQDSSQTAEARAAAAEGLVKREAELQPAYKQMALLYADLHEYAIFNYQCEALFICCFQSCRTNGG